LCYKGCMAVQQLLLCAVPSSLHTGGVTAALVIYWAAAAAAVLCCSNPSSYPS
jgi:hypothetical protein